GSFSRFGDLTRTRRRHGAFPGPLYPVGFRLATSERPS
ncbi:MAG TPA: serine/threonine protein kinase, partial [Streptomyces sp.]|nr:serine/threonine protein kinase [Streptomyces sp.]